MKKEVIVVGGGVAGLSAAIRLAELGIKPTVIEAGGYPSHKICGEFLSPECLGQLARWDIHPLPIRAAVLHTNTNCLPFHLSEPAGGLSHLRLDPALAARALHLGAELLTHTWVSAFRPKAYPADVHSVELSTGDVLETSKITIAAGRMPNLGQNTLKPMYMGFKAHFDNKLFGLAQLEMFSFKGAYIGLSPVEDNKLNVACVAELDAVGSDATEAFIDRLVLRHPKLHALLSNRTSLFESWMTARLPPFGLKETPKWHDAYFIGDAAATVPPACGNGLSLAIAGGRLSAEYLLRGDAEGFKAAWRKRCTRQLFWANAIHKLMLKPSLGNGFIRVAGLFPSLARKLFDLSRHRGSG